MLSAQNQICELFEVTARCFEVASFGFVKITLKFFRSLSKTRFWIVDIWLRLTIARIGNRVAEELLQRPIHRLVEHRPFVVGQGDEYKTRHSTFGVVFDEERLHVQHRVAKR